MELNIQAPMGPRMRPVEHRNEVRERPSTHRGLFGTILSPNDPMGITARNWLKCKKFQRELYQILAKIRIVTMPLEAIFFYHTSC